jgi:hypothetical protein
MAPSLRFEVGALTVIYFGSGLAKRRPRKAFVRGREGEAAELATGGGYQSLAIVYTPPYPVPSNSSHFVVGIPTSSSRVNSLVGVET